jgi:hypothetical protein
LVWAQLVVETVKVLRMDSPFQLTSELAGQCIRWIELCWDIRQDQSPFPLEASIPNPLGQIHQVLGLGPSKFLMYAIAVVLSQYARIVSLADWVSESTSITPSVPSN